MVGRAEIQTYACLTLKPAFILFSLYRTQEQHKTLQKNSVLEHCAQQALRRGPRHRFPSPVKRSAARTPLSLVTFRYEKRLLPSLVPDHRGRASPPSTISHIHHLGHERSKVKKKEKKKRVCLRQLHLHLPRVQLDSEANT